MIFHGNALGKQVFPHQALTKLCRSVTPAKAGDKKSMKKLDSVLQRNDEEALLQKARM